MSNVGDVEAVHRLLERYAAAADRADGEAVAAMFVADGRMEVIPPPPAATQALVGRRAIAARLSALTRYDAAAHLLGERSIELDGDHGTGRIDCVAHHYGGEAGVGMDRMVTLTYHDRYRRTGGDWQFEERRVEMLAEDYVTADSA